MARLRLPDRLVLAGLVLFFVGLALPWFRVPGFSADGWALPFVWSRVPLVIGLLMALQVLGTAYTESQFPHPFWRALHQVGGPVAFGIVALKVLVGEQGTTRGAGLWTSLAGAALLAAGGVLKARTMPPPYRR